MAFAEDRDDFKDYCLRQLGAPVIDINVADEQVDDRVDQALAFYQLYHNEAVERVIYFHKVTQKDIDNGYLTIDSNIFSITKMAMQNSRLFSANFMNNIWQGMYKISYDIGFGMRGCSSGMSNYGMAMQYLADIEFMFSVKNELQFNYRTHKLHIPGKTNDMDVAVYSIVAFEAYRLIDPDANQSIWATPVLIEYTTALIGVQWGTNLSKYDGVQLPGGITLDGDKIYDRYNEIKMKIEEDFSVSHELPVDFYIG